MVKRKSKKIKHPDELILNEFYKIKDSFTFYGIYEGWNFNEDGRAFRIIKLLDTFFDCDSLINCSLIIKQANWNKTKIYKTTKAEKILYSK